MSITFVPKYEFDTDRHKSHRDPHAVICAAGHMGANGEGSVRFWIEKRYPEVFDYKSRVATPAHTETILGRTIYSYHDLVFTHEEGFTEDREKWLLRELVLMIARGDVGAKSAASILWTILSQTAVRERDKWLQEGAPEWFALVDPEREHLKV